MRVSLARVFVHVREFVGSNTNYIKRELNLKFQRKNESNRCSIFCWIFFFHSFLLRSTLMCFTTTTTAEKTRKILRVVFLNSLSACTSNSPNSLLLLFFSLVRLFFLALVARFEENCCVEWKIKHKTFFVCLFDNCSSSFRPTIITFVFQNFESSKPNIKI